MAKRLPSRPDLEHLRRQAKSLLVAIAAKDAAAFATLREHLPAAMGMTDAAIGKAGFRLADAQSAIARQTGFANWPALSRHVDTLRALEGTWSFASLTADGVVVPAAGLGSSRIHIDGDCFRTESPEGTYEGTFDIDVEQAPMHLDIHFAAGPEAGVTNRGVFALDGDRFELCLDVNGRARPKAFTSKPGSGHAHEVLQRATKARPQAVDGGKRAAKGAEAKAKPAVVAATVDAAAFAGKPPAFASRLQGAWSAVRIVRDGVELPAHMLKHARRTARGPELEVAIGGRVIIHAAVRFGAEGEGGVVPVDYLLLGGDAAGAQQLGIFTWRGDDACFCMAAPGASRPAGFGSEPGSGSTLSIWRRDG